MYNREGDWFNESFSFWKYAEGGTKTLPANFFENFSGDRSRDNRTRLIKSIINNDDNQKYLIFIWFTSASPKNLYSLSAKSFLFETFVWKRFDKILEGFRSPGCKKYIRFFFENYRVEKKGETREKVKRKGIKVVNVCHRHIKPISSCYIIHIIYIYICIIYYILYIYICIYS